MVQRLHLWLRSGFSSLLLGHFICLYVPPLLHRAKDGFIPIRRRGIFLHVEPVDISTAFSFQRV
ncbi:hypothetical protein EYF80_007975 [Liparis tanakae]|uniref:Uncharacterized protein n=1 Tax=Liparis tanakae TaxID=230148 RepID=A0A4Z2IVD0_9TELE|nr:hypothetical protein EYF80_007975 [Liparis tanakae]